MNIKKRCCMCQKAVIEVNFNNNESFAEAVKQHGWKILIRNGIWTEFICENCHKKIMLEAEKIKDK